MPQAKNITKPKLISIEDLFAQSWDFYKSNLQKLSYIALLIIAPGIVSYLINEFVPEVDSTFYIVLFFVLFIISAVLMITGEIVLISFIKEKNPNFNISQSFFNSGLKKFFSVLWLNIVVSLITIFGTILLIIPGIYWMIKYYFPKMVLIDQDKKGFQALAESSRLVKNYWFAVFGRIILIGFLLLTISIAIMTLAYFIGNDYVSSLLNWLLSIFMVPFSMIYIYRVYEDLKRIKK